MNLKYFGTDGIRGKVGGGIMNPEFLKKFGNALGQYLRMRHPKGEVHVAIGRDTRKSGREFEKILIDNLLPYGISIDCLGVLPTPAIAYWIDELEADNGIVITASHNPASDNGIKLFNAHGVKQTLDKEAMIEPLIDEPLSEISEYPKAELLHHPDAVSGYVDNVCELMPRDTLKDWKIVLDTANGATCETSKRVFEYFGADLILRGNNPNGKNINENVGSEFPDGLSSAVKKSKARIGFAHDGDGDRVIVCDEDANIVHGDQILGILALHALKKEELSNNIVVATVHSNLGLDKALEMAGAEVVRTDVGDRNVFQKMVELKASLGGESSGHYIFSEYAQTGDGLISAIKVIEVMIETGRKLADLKKDIPLLPQMELSLQIRERKDWDKLENMHKSIALAKERLGEDSYILARYSGTEPKIRLLVQGSDQEKVADAMESIKVGVSKDLELVSN